jgi:hypothetical protein
MISLTLSSFYLRPVTVTSTNGIAHPAPAEGNLSLPSTDVLLVSGGDARIRLDPDTQTNKYGCRATPDGDVAAFGSCTASTTSDAGFSTADALRARLLAASHSSAAKSRAYAFEIERLKHELSYLCGLSGIASHDIILSPSGTDLHSIAARLSAGTGTGGTFVIMDGPFETGRGVQNALFGRINPLDPLQDGRTCNDRLTNGQIHLLTIPIRDAEGGRRSLADIDRDVAAVLSHAALKYRHALLVVTDVSKTGLLAPGLQHAFALRDRWPGTLDILIDACQFRLTSKTLHAYVKRGCLVAITGSKFLGGPPFSAALLVPAEISDRFRRHPVDPALRYIANRMEWPRDWPGIEQLDSPPNYGLLFRWTAAIEELRRLKSVPETAVSDFISQFSSAIAARMQSDPVFEVLPTAPLDRSALSNDCDGWDRWQTIFPFLLYHGDRDEADRPLSSAETRHVFNGLSADVFNSPDWADVDRRIGAVRCQVGQPVPCGTRQGIEISALRLCLSAPLIVEATQSGRAASSVIERALPVLDKTSLLLASGRSRAEPRPNRQIFIGHDHLVTSRRG